MGSRTSRTPSPRRLNASTVSVMARPGNIMSQGARNSSLRPRPSMSPHSAAGGCTPKPRKPRAAASRMAVEMPSVARTMMDGSTLGSTCLNTILKLESPMTRAAAT